jgi:glycosyltransferase involved in cell wall biosynthesis
MKKYFDCSINELSNKLHNSVSLGPIENDIMKDLGKYASLYGWERIYDYKQADLFVTNGFYIDEILEWSDKHSIAKIKRMDGIYWKDAQKEKNIIYNKAAKESDYVIFISNYSKLALYKLYNYLPKNYTIILNNVDNTIFFPKKHKNDNFTLISSATNWSREEKRLNSLLELSRIIDKTDVIRLIGQCDIILPKNIIKIGYISEQNRMNDFISTSDAYLSLYFRDAGSKTTCQAVNCHLPILYSNSGGLSELVQTNGIKLDDYKNIDFLSYVPELSILDLHNKYRLLKKYYKDIINKYQERESYQETLSKYFEIFKMYS